MTGLLATSISFASLIPAPLLEFAQYSFSRREDLLEKTIEHLLLTGFSAGLAIAIGIPLGILIRRYTKLEGVVLGSAGVVQTIPSIAMLALLMIPLGIGFKPAIAALTLYALLPIIRNTYAGLSGVDAEIIEAATGLGFTRGQRLWAVELPLALPIIIAGIRTSVVIIVGIATLSAYIGAGGLGDFIIRGMSMQNNLSIMLGVVAASLMALFLDGLIGLLERLLKRRFHQ